MKRYLIIASIVIAVVLVIAISLPFLINVDSFRPQIEKKLSASLGRAVHIGKLEASLFSGGAEASDISIGDDPAFGNAPFLKTSSLQLGLEWMPLIFSRQIKVTSLTVRKPEILLLKNSAGKWNFASLGGASAKKDETKSGPAPDFSVAKFEIQDGKIRVANLRGHSLSQEQTYEKVNLLATNISTTSAVPFTLSAVTPGGGALEVEGKAGPLDKADASRTPLEAKISLDHTDLGAAALIDPASGLGGTLDVDANVKSDGRKLRAEGKATANNLRLVKGGSPARQTVSLDYNADYAVAAETAIVNATLHAGNSQATAAGTINTRGETSMAHLKLTGRNMAVNDVAGLLPALGVVLPAGTSLQGGVANMNLNAEGPLDRLVITGPVEITGTRLNGYNLGSKLGAIAALSGLQPGSDTLIQTFSSVLKVAPEGIRAGNIMLDVPSIGQLTGDGVVGSDNSLDFRMLLKSSSATGGGLIGKMTGAAAGGQTKGIPFLVRGTTSNPTFLPSVPGVGDTLKALQGKPGQGQDQGLGGILGGFLDKKKKKP